jgi:hypothetical protein
MNDGIPSGTGAHFAWAEMVEYILHIKARRVLYWKEVHHAD